MPRDLKVGVGVTILLWHPVPNMPPKILMGHRCGKLMNDTWALPGGWQDAGEQPIDTCLRELAEEAGITGIYRHGVQLLTIEAWDLKDLDCWCNTIYFMSCVDSELEAKVCEPDKIDEWRWFHAHEIPSNLAETTEKALAKFYGQAWRRSR